MLQISTTNYAYRHCLQRIAEAAKNTYTVVALHVNSTQTDGIDLANICFARHDCVLQHTEHQFLFNEILCDDRVFACAEEIFSILSISYGNRTMDLAEAQLPNFYDTFGTLQSYNILY